MKTTIFDFVRDYIYIILGIMCVLIIGVIYIVSTSRVRVRPNSVIETANVIYTHEEEGEEHEVYDKFTDRVNYLKHKIEGQIQNAEITVFVIKKQLPVGY